MLSSDCDSLPISFSLDPARINPDRIADADDRGIE
jgi:hypothetical protein